MDKGTIKYDFGKKKQKQQDTTVVQSDDDEDSVIDYRALKSQEAAKRRAQHKDNGVYDFKKDGIFRGLFTAGLNACQIDGDNQWGYKYLGAEVGVGAMARFHRFFSVSLELDYTMKGARDRLASTADVLRDYQVQWDYVAAPVAVNAHLIRDILTISAGFAPAVMVRYREYNESGINVTGHSGYGQPSPFDLDAFAGIQVTFKKHYALGFKYSYSTISIRHAGLDTRVDGQYNNDLTFRFVYILGPLKKKK